MMAAIVAPAGARSIAIMRACLVSGRTADFDDTDADRVRDLPLPIFRALDRVETLVFDLGLVMGSSELARRHPPHPSAPLGQKT
jgi:hypothetical protein